MNMLINILLIIAGMAFLIKGSDILVIGASSLARRYKISELAIGLTIVAFGTSLPEFIISFIASINSLPEIALGNVIGSNLFNLLFILGITSIFIPVTVQKNTARIEIPFSLLGAVLLLLMANFGLLYGAKYVINRIDGSIFLIFFGLFLFYVFKSMKTGETETNETDTSETAVKPISLVKSLIFIVLGLALLIGGGRIVVIAAVNLAEALNISEKIISLTIVATGTSLPELIISITAMIKKKSDLAIGNIVGSNIFNILFILGASAVARPLEFDKVFNQDLYLLIFGTILLLIAMFTGKKNSLDRWEGAIFVLLYIGYVVFLIMRN